MKRLQYPNKNNLILKATYLHPEHTRFGLIGFRTFNKDNSVNTKIWAIEQRLKRWNKLDGKNRVLILCYLLHEKKPLELEPEVLEILSQKYKTITFLTESQLQ